MRLEWKLDEVGALMCRFDGPYGKVEAFITPRPVYCDRGHWQFGIMTGVPSLDNADSFPRYYMGLRTALQEASDWIMWRLYKQSSHNVLNIPTQSVLADGFTMDYPEPVASPNS